MNEDLQFMSDFWEANPFTEPEKIKAAAEKMTNQELLEAYAGIKALIFIDEMSLLHYQFRFIPREKVYDLIIEAFKLNDRLHDEMSKNGYEVLPQMWDCLGGEIFIGSKRNDYKEVDLDDLYRQIQQKDKIIGQQIDIMRKLSEKAAV